MNQEEMSGKYCAVVAYLKGVRKHPNADRLQIAECMGYNVIVDMNSREGDKVVLFPDDGQLSEKYCEVNGLVGYVDSDGKKKGGYFCKKRRVRAQVFRGVRSEAYIAYPCSFDFTGVDVGGYDVGTRFCELNGVSICNKYVVPYVVCRQKQKKLNEELKRLFPEHVDVNQFRLARDEDLVGLVTITCKLHGTSQRSALLFLDKSVRRWYHRFGFRPRPKYEWTSVFGTRRVIRGEVDKDDVSFRAKSHKVLEPHIGKGEVWYYELVGFEDSGVPIMLSVDTKKMGKEFVKRFGEVMVFKYGCQPCQCDIYVYRIAVVNSDGVLYELPWGCVKDKCRKAGVKTVPEVGQFLVRDVDVGDLKKFVGGLIDMEDVSEPIDHGHVREGFCIRVDSCVSGRIKLFKDKMFVFKVLEGIVKDAGIIDKEEAESCLVEEGVVEK